MIYDRISATNVLRNRFFLARFRNINSIVGEKMNEDKERNEKKMRPQRKLSINYSLLWKSFSTFVLNSFRFFSFASFGRCNNHEKCEYGKCVTKLQSFTVFLFTLRMASRKYRKSRTSLPVSRCLCSIQSGNLECVDNPKGANLAQCVRMWCVSSL